MYAAGTVALHKSGDLINGNVVEVSFNGVLEAGCRNGEFDGLLAIKAVQQAVNQACAEGVAAAYTVNDMYCIFLGEISFAVSIEHSCPVVIVGGNAFTKRDCNLFEAEAVGKLLGNVDIAFSVAPPSKLAFLAGFEPTTFRLGARKVFAHPRQAKYRIVRNYKA